MFAEFRAFSLAKKAVVVSNDGGALTSDAGVLLLRAVDRRLGLTRRLARGLKDWRVPGKVRHSVEALLAQRVLQIALGYEDANDANTLRRDPTLKMALERPPFGPDLAGQSSLSRLENQVTPQDCYRIAEAFVQHYIDLPRRRPPTRIILDPDTTDDLTHGQQQGTLFSTHYGGYCYLPLLVFAQEQEGGPQHLVAPLLLPGKTPTGALCMRLLRRILLRLQKAFPECRIEVRADSGFAAPELFEGCDALQVATTIAVAQNRRLLPLAQEWIRAAEAIYEEVGESVKVYGEFTYEANRWHGPRQVVVKAEVMPEGTNPRFIASTRTDLDPEARYHFYCQRGDVENRIKELKEDLHADRLSCHRFLANQFRLFLHAAAYLLLQALREELAGTELESAEVGMLRLKLLKVGARLHESVRRLRVRLPTAYPYLRFWLRLARASPT